MDEVSASSTSCCQWLEEKHGRDNDRLRAGVDERHGTRVMLTQQRTMLPQNAALTLNFGVFVQLFGGTTLMEALLN